MKYWAYRDAAKEPLILRGDDVYPEFYYSREKAKWVYDYDLAELAIGDADYPGPDPDLDPISADEAKELIDQLT